MFTFVISGTLQVPEIRSNESNITWLIAKTNVSIIYKKQWRIIALTLAIINVRIPNFKI